MSKITYVTLVNEDYKPYLDQLIKSHQLFCGFGLIVYTINFEITDQSYENITFKKFKDENILEYENGGQNRYIKNEFEKHKYTTLLKSKVLKFFIDLYDYYFFIDCDGLLTKNSDTLLVNVINEFGLTKFPVSVKYYHQYSTSHNRSVEVFNDSGFNPESLGYYPLIELFGSDYSIIDYVTTYCVFYTKECFNFLEEVEQICFDERVIQNYQKYLPLGDETVFNYLYSKYNFKSYISKYLCYNIYYNISLQDSLSNIEKGNNFISYIHTKRYFINPNNERDFSKINEDEYNHFLNSLQKIELPTAGVKLTAYDKNIEGDMIFFTPDIGYNDIFSIDVVSLFRPNLELVYIMHLIDGVNYYIGAKHDVWVKDQFLIIQNSNIIKNVIKIS